MCSASTYPARCWSGRGRARRRTFPIDFVLADATVYPFEPASFDVLASRFGVMFFADPALSFANMRKALRPSGRLAFACWREPRENPFFMAPLAAAYKHVPKLPQQGPEDPGPFAFASEARVRRILDAAGFTGVEMEACPLLLDSAIGRGLDGAVQGALEIGPVSRALDGQPEELRKAAANFDPRSADAVRQGRRGAAAGVGLDRHGKGVVSRRAHPRATVIASEAKQSIHRQRADDVDCFAAIVACAMAARLSMSWRLTPIERRIAIATPPNRLTTQRRLLHGAGGDAHGCSNDALVRSAC